ncbi:M23 family metallopeptidase [Schaalia sp. lx-100]|uniref:M23 family metallopeptidase n=1 Tax=Schaalia sp. lx-100 TaxID=2899081 RepID=UPI001E5B7720|nr:peptidoglycan DD-metalloendopeptidase family protein [Schaalia sp. lx-100]MCD4557126.1 peptidoglycan DD-metalloendopeptidase family protein [Schaalia sp. lx-100]
MTTSQPSSHRTSENALLKQTLTGICLCLFFLLIALPAHSTDNPPQRPWLWPTGHPVPIARPFTEPAQPWLSGHRGVDFDVPIASEVYAPTAGTVSFVGTVVDRPVLSLNVGSPDFPLRTTFEPINAQVVRGQKVHAGELLGYVAEGHSPGALHWGVKVSAQKWLNPLLFLRERSVLKIWDGWSTTQ